MRARMKDYSPNNISQSYPGESNSHIDTVRQLVLLAKQNKNLRDELEQARSQIKQMAILKAKYKSKYKKLKKETQQRESRTQAQRIIERSMSGKIYRQKRIIPPSPSAPPNQAVTDNFIHPLGPANRHPGDGIAIDDPYQITWKQKSNGLTKIQTGIQTIIDLLSNLKDKSSQSYIEIAGNTAKLDTRLCDQIRQFKHILSKLEEQRGINPEVTYKSDSPDELEEELVQTESLPENDKNLNGRKRQGVTTSQQKTSKSKSQRPISEYKRMTFLRSQGNKMEQEKGSSDDEESTRSKWEMLNQIGKKLQNWKFAILESDPIEQDNQ